MRCGKLLLEDQEDLKAAIQHLKEALTAAKEKDVTSQAKAAVDQALRWVLGEHLIGEDASSATNQEHIGAIFDIAIYLTAEGLVLFTRGSYMFEGHADATTVYMLEDLFESQTVVSCKKLFSQIESRADGLIAVFFNFVGTL